MPGLCQRSTRAPSRLGHSLRIGWGLFLSSIYFAHKMKVKKKRKKEKIFHILRCFCIHKETIKTQRSFATPITHTHEHIATLSQNEILKCRFLKSLLMIFEPIRSETKTRIIKCCAEFRLWLFFIFFYLISHIILILLFPHITPNPLLFGCRWIDSLTFLFTHRWCCMNIGNWIKYENTNTYTYSTHTHIRTYTNRFRPRLRLALEPLDLGSAP